MTEPKVRVDKASIDYQLGQISSKLDTQNGRLDRMSEKIGGMTEVIAGLPCAVHSERIEYLTERLAGCGEEKKWNLRNKLTFKQMIICAIVGALITGVATVVALFGPLA